MPSLPELYVARAELSLKIWQAEKDAAAETLAVTPADGWPGKNAEQRDTARAQALATNAVIHAAQVQADACQAKLMTLTGQIEAAEAERRAQEWSIRASIVAALMQRNIQPNGRGDRAEAAFDDAPLYEMDARGEVVAEETPF